MGKVGLLIHVPPSGPLSARHVILGESPGEQEELALRPFVGPSGKFLDAAIGLEEKEGVYITNVRKTRPPNVQQRKQRLEEIASQHEELSAEMSRLTQARTLTVVGADALRSTLGTERISHYHGSFLNRAEVEAIRQASPVGLASLIPLPALLHTVAVTLHPAFALHGNLQFKFDIIQTIGRAHRWSKREEGPIRPSLDLFDLECDLFSLVRALNDAQTVCIDIETPHEGAHKIDLCGFGVPDGRVWVAPWDQSVKEIVIDLMRSPRVIVGHNLLFDLVRFLNLGIEIGERVVIFDTIAGGQLLWPPPSQQSKKKKGKGQKGPSRLSLAACTLRLLDGWVNWKQPDTWETQAIYKASYPSVRQWMWPRLYNALDVHGNLKMSWPMRELLRREAML